MQQASPDYLVKMRPGKTERPPFFCAHGAGGSLLSLRTLAMAMPSDLPFYGLQAKGFDGSEPFYSVNETARCYLELVRKTQSHGPYYLGGCSYGGLVAFEMAHLLEKQGERISVLVLIDSYNLAFGKFLPRHEFLSRNALFYMRRLKTHAMAMAAPRPRVWRRYIGALLGRMVVGEGGNQCPVDQKDVEIVGVGDTGLGDVLRRVEQASVKAARAFVPKPFHGSAVVIRASRQPMEPYRDKYLGWGPVVKGRIEVIEIPGDHESILEEPAVQRIAEALDARLRQGRNPDYKKTKNT